MLDVAGLWSFALGLRGPSARVAGVLVHLLVSVGVAAGYALGFRVAEVTDIGWAWGMVGGVIHWIAGGTVLGVFPGDDVVARSPGPFARRLGPPGSVGFLMAHLVFGLVVGVVYFTLHSSGGMGAAL